MSVRTKDMSHLYLKLSSQTARHPTLMRFSGSPTQLTKEAAHWRVRCQRFGGGLGQRRGEILSAASLEEITG
jgi:hypothetical protein